MSAPDASALARSRAAYRAFCDEIAKHPVSALTRARAAWGGEISPWVEALARACDETSQTAVAKRLGYPATHRSRL